MSFLKSNCNVSTLVLTSRWLSTRSQCSYHSDT